ncbi:MAG TPA: hypothetical protein VFS83_13125 [Ktedonobacterales bacterium]|nr:hypothetical protein [Ktedonobacterales bacterium]
MLEQLAADYGFTVYSLDAGSLAGRRLRQVSGLPALPGIYVDLELVAWGQPEPETLRQAVIGGLRLTEKVE